ncbi:hypothetical protein PTTG_07430, partial [Puccinia triticina 1-1 BBBD Race 1]
MDDLELQLPPCPATSPPASSLHIFLTKALSEQDANGAALLDARFVDLLLELLANNKRLIRCLEATVNQLNAKVDPVIKRLAAVEILLKSGPMPNASTKKSFVSAASMAPVGSIHAPPAIRPPSNPTIALLKPKRVVIHSNPANTSLKNEPSGALVQKANNTLLGLNAKVGGKLVSICGASVMPSGDVSFYTKNRAHQK